MGARAPRLCLLLSCFCLLRVEPAAELEFKRTVQHQASALTWKAGEELQQEPAPEPSHSYQMPFAVEDVTTAMEGQDAEAFDAPAMSSWERRLHRAKCAPSYLFSCFNGGECVHPALCDCRRFNATGPRCQLVYNAGPERDSICRAWGQHHVETFDGLYYYFSGKGSYMLVGHHEPEGQSFSIQVHNDPQCGPAHYTCPRSVSLFLSGEREICLAKEVTHGGIRIQLPQVVAGVQLQQLAGYVIARYPSAFTLAWDGASAVYIKMSPEFVGWTHGLCGNNNADPQDDLVTSYGKLTDDIGEFVHSWQEQVPNSPPVPVMSSLPRPPCLQQSPASMQGVYERCEVLLRSPFDACHAYVSPLPFTASCTSDLCQSGGDEATWCRALTEYARACAQAGRPLQGWRTQLSQCTVRCKEKIFIYNECIACCPASCQSHASCVDSEIACVDGCYCPNGLIFEDGVCMSPAECPCEFHGTLHPPGSVVTEDCNTCTCTAGKWVCSSSVCPAECSVTGDIHFTTFDGRRYTFPATCQYILAKSRSSGTFTVTLQNAPCGLNQDGACVQSVSVILHQDPRRQVTLTQAGDVLLFDQYKITPPYSDDAFEIQKLSSVFLRVRTNVGVRILYDREGLRLYLQVDQRWVEDTVGLCGTFNGNTQDDFLSPVGVPESTPQLFGNSWKTLSACVPLAPGSLLDPCDVHLQAASYALQACSVLTGELFAPCSAYLSPIPYFEQCRRDACRCGQPCLCATLAHYARLCRRHGLPVDFRARLPACALSCEATKEYSPCVALCTQTCQDLASPDVCGANGGGNFSRDECVEGCTCPPDTFLDTQTDLCVPRNQCSCHFQGVDYPPGDSDIPSLGHCHCKDGVMSCDSRAPAATCPAGQVFVNCSELHPDPELSRERTCEQQLLNLSLPARGPCLSGCACPLGLLRHGDSCFPPEECPCTWKGKEYFPGDQVVSSCHTCVCQRGSFQCTLHPCASTCTAYGDRHYRTFDGLPFDFVGACKVHLVKSTSELSFSVMVEDVNCYSAGVICRKSISINVGSSLIIFDDDSGDPSPESFLDEKQAVHIWRAGFFTLVHFPREHITLLWDQRTTVHVQAGPQWQGQLVGLCGNFDLKTVNEMRTPENLELTNPQEFGSSWAAVECPDTPDPRDTCVLNPLREPFARKECGILLSEVFETCHPVVDVTWFYSNCLTDTCGCSRGGDCECFCASVAAYAHQCCQHGVVIDWRTPRICPYDCDFFNKALGKGPYQLSSVMAGSALVAMRAVDGDIALVRAEDLVPGDISSFLLTAALSKAKAHDPDVVSLEAADRPNFYLHVTANGSIRLAKWRRDEAFHQHASFSLHRGTWQAGLVALESLAKPGSFLQSSGLKLALRTYEHTEAFRGGALFRLLDAKPSGAAYPICEWHYDACASPCFQTCRDPQAASCQDVPRVEGCVPVCPTPKVLDEVTQRCVYLEDCVEPALRGPKETLGNETLAPGQVLPTTSDKQQLPQEPPGASTHIPVLDPLAPLTSAPNPPMAATEGPVASPGSTQPTLQTSLGLTTSNLPAGHTEATAREEGAASLLATSPPPGSSSSLPSSLQTPTSGILSSTTETTKVTLTFAGSPNTTVTSRSPPVPRFPLMTKAVTVPSHDSFPVKTTPLRPSWSLSSRPTTSPGVTSWPPTSLGSHLSTVVTNVTNKTETSLSVLAQSTKSSSQPLSTAYRAPASPLVTKGLEGASATEKGDAGHSQLTELPVSPPPSSAPIDLPHPAQHTTTAPGSPALSPGILGAGSPSTGAHGLGTTALASLETTRPPHLLSGLPPDTSLPLAKVGTSAPVATPASKGYVPTPPPQHWATTSATAMTVTPLTQTTLSLTAPLMSAVEEQAHSPSPTAPHITAMTPSFGASAGTAGVPPMVSVAPQKSTTQRAAILSKKVSPPTLISDSVQGGFTELTPTVSHTVAPLVTEAEGPQAGTVPLVPTTHSLSRVSARTASREGPLVLLPQLAEAHGTPAGLQPQEDLVRQATTEQTGRSAPAQSIAEGSMEAEGNTSAICVPIAEQDCVRHICLEGQLIRVNQTQHCPQGAVRPRCGVLGLAVRVGGDHCCPLWECACRCSIFPDLSFVTFDGSHAALFKEAIYILSQSPDEIISVHALDCKSANLGHLNWPPFCLVILNVTHLTHHISIDRFNRKVTVDSQVVWPPMSRYGFRIEDTGHMYIVQTPSHIQIQWLHSSGLMILEASKASKTQGHGLCGICDGDTANDLTLKDGSVLGEAEDPALFLDSWQVPSSLTSEGQTRFRPDSCSTADCSPCLRMVSNRTFSACHSFVSPESFCELWIRDTKYVQQPCVALTVYVAMCHKFHVCIEWRGSDYCPFLCSSDSTYQACVAACEPPETCQDGVLGPLDPEQCQVLGEGCVCSEGTILHRRHSALCIPEDKCACTDSTGVPRALGETWNSSLSGCCQQQCQAPDTITPMDPDCPGPRPESCPRFGEVILLQPTEDPCCLGSVCVCNQTLCEGLAPTCRPGHRLIPHFQEDSCCPSYSCECDPGLCEAEQVPTCRQDQVLIEGRLGDSCCPSYFCGCGECPDAMPECQEGEVLTVHRNSTELCCPLYQCVCESFRCPQIQCGMGTSLVEVWSPDRCCPYKSCECDCDTIPVPRCHLWEKSQLDEEFMHSVENVCGCAKYECVKAPVCLSRELGVMQPGQTVVELSADGVCHTSRCTDVLDPLTNFYQINITSVLCDMHCEANQEYDHPRDLAACCGSCRNVSCLFTFPNGTTSLFLPGASWIADCARHHCGSTPLGAVLVRSPISCPPLNETECAKVGGSVVPSLEGCCRTCKEDGRSCKKVTIRMTIRKNDCRSNTPVNLVSCDGRCPSASIYNHNINTYARFCKCCREVGLQRRSVQLFCATNATWVPYTVQEPTDCACQWS
ncbi:otogelin (predicted) [Rattus norvegicus]|uniref:Otogelin n=2 Tax=Rattus norvegicus TaxID=10116 RepID=A6JBB7_RAT|nr:otogelin precursor [Rattus norvegicus]EDM07267.1 otogelin (predicted) [Rattus norvegicus]|eukprot:NP_001099732.1 otogelin precursor [Rattus norvegicus]